MNLFDSKKIVDAMVSAYFYFDGKLEQQVDLEFLREYSLSDLVSCNDLLKTLNKKNMAKILSGEDKPYIVLDDCVLASVYISLHAEASSVEEVKPIFEYNNKVVCLIDSKEEE